MAFSAIPLMTAFIVCVETQCGCAALGFQREMC
jgi:hypothetical protein